ncbi:hypothetical protein [Clostridium amazonitimonense]|nr:hypothetical protein [Clostridium amazonitimonense]
MKKFREEDFNEELNNINTEETANIPEENGHTSSEESSYKRFEEEKKMIL